MLTSALIKKRALEFGADICGIGDISLFEGTNPQRDPRRICPKGKSVIGFAFRVPKGLYDAMERGIQFYNYTMLGVKYIDEELVQMVLLRMASMIENEGYDACVQRNVSNLRIKGDKTQNPELFDTYELSHAEAISAGKPAPDVIMDFTQAAEICGLGCRSLKGNVLTREFGPYVRFAFIVTDAPLEFDAPFSGSLCDKCGACIKACPGNAVSADGLDTWQCSVYYRGAHKSNPYMTDKDLVDEPDREAILNGEKRFDAASARALYPKLDFLPYSVNGYVGCLCGKACDRACYHHLQKEGLLCSK